MSKEKERGDILRIAIMRSMDKMFDSRDTHGIYDTGQFMDDMENLLCALMAAPEVGHLSGSEALYGFIGWVTCIDAPPIGATHDAAPWVELIETFRKNNGLHPPREGWDMLLQTHPETP